MVILLEKEKTSIAIGTGLVLGLAALTRGILWPLPILLCPLTFLVLKGNRGARLKLVGCLLLGYLIVMIPWAIRNTELQGVLTVVNTQGGITLLMGNYEHTKINRAWDPIALKGKKSIFVKLYEEHPEASTWTLGQREKWAQKTAVNYMLDHPWLTVKRSIIKFSQFWGLERSIVGGFRAGYYHPTKWFVGAVTFVIPLVYCLVMGLACFGLFGAPPTDWRVQGLFLLIILFISGLHAIVFGHSRYHLPLMPLIILYAAAALMNSSSISVRQGVLKVVGPMTVFSGLLLAWGRELLVVEADRIKFFMTSLFG